MKLGTRTSDATTVSFEAVDVVLEVVDRLVQAVEEAEEGVARVVDRRLEDGARGGTGVDARGDPVDGREGATGGRLPNGQDAGGADDDVELDVLRPLAAFRYACVEEHREDEAVVPFETGAICARRGREQVERGLGKRRVRRAPELLARRVDQVGQGVATGLRG